MSASPQPYATALQHVASFIQQFQPAPPPQPAASASAGSGGSGGGMAVPMPGLPVALNPALKRPESVGRLVVQGIGGPGWTGDGMATGTDGGGGGAEGPQGLGGRDAVRLLWRLRQAAQDGRCAVVASCPAGGVRGCASVRVSGAVLVLCAQPAVPLV